MKIIDSIQKSINWNRSKLFELKLSKNEFKTCEYYLNIIEEQMLELNKNNYVKKIENNSRKIEFNLIEFAKCYKEKKLQNHITID